MSTEDFTKKSYDYVIIGGGTAGLVLAARLSEDPSVTVGVLEAGKNHLGDPIVDAPGLYMETFGKPDYDWRYKTVPQKGTGGKVHGWVRGKALGGSSAVNFNMFSMASRQDLDNWAELGNEGWGFDDLAPYYRKFETYHAPSETLSKGIGGEYVDPLLRGTDGPIQISFCEGDLQWQQEIWPQTCMNAGYPVPKDPRTGSAIGGFSQLTTVDPKHVRRSYSARNYYEPNAARPNLSVLTEALVTKIELRKEGAKDAVATGVSFTVGGTTHTVKAVKEVVVCGGSINSPQILELSGIGSPTVLQEAGVDVVVENHNVGEGLNDHAIVGICFQVRDEYPTAEILFRNPDVAQQAMQAYLEHKAGPFANATASTSFASLSLVDPNLSDPEAHIHSLIASYNASHPNSDPAGRDTLLARQLLNPKEAVTQIVILPIGFDADNIPTPENLFLHDAPGNWITLGAGSTRSFSRGSVHIESSDPTKQPRIDPAYYAHPLDEDLAARCILHSANIAKAEPLYSKLKHEPNGDPVVMPKMKQKLGFGFPKTLEQAKKIVHAATATEYHPVGTCAMLPRGKGGVVDSECRVYGTANVRVVDASIFPTHVQGNIVSVVYAVAEKAADIIKGAGSTTGEKSSKGSALQGLSEKIIPAVQAVAEKLADALGSSA